MKRIKNISIAALMAATLLTTAFQCGTHCGPPDETLYAMQIQRTTCGEHLPQAATKDLDEDDTVASLEEHYLLENNNGCIRVTHYNWTVPCDMTGVYINISREGNTITVSEYTDGGYVNCLCSIDNQFDIHGLTSGTYTIVFPDVYPDGYQEEFTL